MPTAKKIKSAARTFVTHEFPALFAPDSEILMLGSIPSPKSREQGFYYGHPQNRFWKVMAQVLGEPLPATIDEKKNMLLKHKIALWDVLDSCTIVGASDTSIEDVTPNDISKIVAKSRIKRILCTGATAHKLYQKYCESATGMPAIKLPSTSPANCATSLEKLVKAYQQAFFVKKL
ncbi:DNA-deoxyinosine glycosylase [Fibrobacter sp.]|uniref:DNA-deoxyinosine glycosylase n=1 Tax=Fibrobacter sp. TaxID=35828 RepID=UPI00388D47FC